MHHQQLDVTTSIAHSSFQKRFIADLGFIATVAFAYSLIGWSVPFLGAPLFAYPLIPLLLPLWFSLQHKEIISPIWIILWCMTLWLLFVPWMLGFKDLLCRGSLILGRSGGIWQTTGEPCYMNSLQDVIGASGVFYLFACGFLWVILQEGFEVRPKVAKLYNLLSGYVGFAEPTGYLIIYAAVGAFIIFWRPETFLLLGLVYGVVIFLVPNRRMSWLTRTIQYVGMGLVLDLFLCNAFFNGLCTISNGLFSLATPRLCLGAAFLPLSLPMTAVTTVVIALTITIVAIYKKQYAQSAKDI